VVDVSDRRVTIRCGAPVAVPGADECLQCAVEASASGVTADHDAVAGDQPPQGFLSGGGGEQAPGDAGGDGAVARGVGRERAGWVEQGLDRHQDLHLDGDVEGACLPGQPLDEGVGQDLSAGAGDRLGGGRLGRHGEDVRMIGCGAGPR
jgi:hypothetical protein